MHFTWETRKMKLAMDLFSIQTQEYLDESRSLPCQNNLTFENSLLHQQGSNYSNFSIFLMARSTFLKDHMLKLTTTTTTMKVSIAFASRQSTEAGPALLLKTEINQ